MAASASPQPLLAAPSRRWPSGARLSILRMRRALFSAPWKSPFSIRSQPRSRCALIWSRSLSSWLDDAIFLVATIASKLLQGLEVRAMVSNMIRRSFALVLGSLAAVGCPSRFDPRAQPNISSPDQGADRAFSDARKQFEAGQYDAARLSFHQFVEQFPQDPLKPFAQIFMGRAAYEK